MDTIFFEKQEGSLCAQHALNALLQGSYFTAPDLAEIANRLDVQEQQVLNQNNIQNHTDSEFSSQNMDDSGFFSVQVLGEALKIWNLDLIPMKNPSVEEALQAQIDPTSVAAYICNFREHWFTIRKFAVDQWFNLNSLQNRPEFVSNTYLSLLLKQLENEGYSIFVIRGALPQCQADEVLSFSTEAPPTEHASQSARSDVRTSSVGDDDDLARALAMSRAELDADDETLQSALRMSLMGEQSMSSATDDDDLKLALKLSMTVNGEHAEMMHGKDETTAMSNVPMSAEELRRKRLEYLEKKDLEDKD